MHEPFPAPAPIAQSILLSWATRGLLSRWGGGRSDILSNQLAMATAHHDGHTAAITPPPGGQTE